MRRSISIFAMGFAAWAGAATAEPDAAAEDFQGYVIGGVFAAPEYEGGSDYIAAPLFAGGLSYGGLEFELRGLEARLNAAPGDGIQFGPIVQFKPGRSDLDNNVVDALPDTDDAVYLGGFVGYQTSGVVMAHDQASIGLSSVVDVGDGDGGFLIALEAEYGVQLNEHWSVGASAGTSFADDDYMQTNFGVSAAGSAASGLAAFDAGGGIKDVSVGANASYAFTPSFSVTAFAGYTRLLSDAADSSIVKEEGSADQFSGGVGLGYRF